jgi:hypothetical protein
MFKSRQIKTYKNRRCRALTSKWWEKNNRSAGEISLPAVTSDFIAVKFSFRGVDQEELPAEVRHCLVERYKAGDAGKLVVGSVIGGYVERIHPVKKYPGTALDILRHEAAVFEYQRYFFEFFKKSKLVGRHANQFEKWRNCVRLLNLRNFFEGCSAFCKKSARSHR